MLLHPARMCKHMRWGLMQRFPKGLQRQGALRIKAGLEIKMWLAGQEWKNWL